MCKISRNSIGRSLGKAKVIYARDVDARKAINKYHSNNHLNETHSELCVPKLDSKLDDKQLKVVLYNSKQAKKSQAPREQTVPRVNRKITKAKRDPGPRVQVAQRGNDVRRGGRNNGNL